MLLLHDDPSAFASMSAEDMQRVIEKYMAWGSRLRSAGILVDGQKLTDDPGKIIRKKDGRLRTTDGPHSESKEVLGGYYTIEAADYAQAVERASDCPQLEFGGTIEVREIDVM
jgi:hypothetical protein